MNTCGAGRTLARVGVVVGLIAASTAGVAAPANGAAPAWRVVATAAGAAYGNLAAVSCPTPTVCFAVGTQDTPSIHTKLIERWNGKTWTAQASPNPSGTTSSHLAAVQCTSGTSCLTVGQYSTSSTTKALALRWDGKRWSLVANPKPPGAAVSGLADLQCTTSVSCFAVGGYFVSTPTSSAEMTLIERWNGTAWSIVPSPNVTDAFDSSLAGVACATSTSCWAVGNSHGEDVTNTLIEHWDGTSWSIVPSPNPGSSTDSELSSVACPLATGCVAVGSGHGTLVEVGNGTSWSVATSPNPEGSTGASLNSISCPDVRRCFAVGDFFKQTTQQRLVEVLTAKGTSIVSVPVPTGTKRSSLGGVSCATAGNCFAVGEYRKGPSRRPFLVRYS